MNLAAHFLDRIQFPPRQSVSEWAEAHRILDARTSASPGRWRNARAPYLVGMMDAISDSSVEQIIIVACTQVGKTECLLNGFGYAIDMDPGPILVVQPREDDAETFAVNRLHPMINGCEVLKNRLTQRPTIAPNECRFDRVTAWLVGSNSPAALASKPIRWLFLDEVNKYPMYSGKEADPIKLAEERTKTFWNRKIVKVSTPTTSAGYISQAFEASNKHYFYVPCHHCGAFQQLTFKRVKWATGARGEDIKREGAAWYECEHCVGKWSDTERKRAVALGEWRGMLRRGRRQTIGFHISALYSPFLSMADVAAEFLSCGREPALLQNFVNSWLGENWEDMKQSSNAEQILKRKQGFSEGVVPENAVALLGATDVQAGHVWAGVFAFMKDRRVVPVRIHRVDGEGTTARALQRAWDEVLSAEYPVENSNEIMVPSHCAIDSGFATQDVYYFCLTHPNCLPFKGQDTEGVRASNWTSKPIDRYPDGKAIPRGLTLYFVHTNFYRDQVLRAYERPIDEPGAWLVHETMNQEFADHLAAWGTKVKKDSRGRESTEWHQLRKDDHCLDLCCYASALASIRGVERKNVDNGNRKKRAYGLVGVAGGGAL